MEISDPALSINYVPRPDEDALIQKALRKGQTGATETQVYRAAWHDSRSPDGRQCSLCGDDPHVTNQSRLYDFRVLPEP